MYYIDSDAGGVDALDYDVDTGTIDRRRRLADIPRFTGLADGMTLGGDDLGDPYITTAARVGGHSHPTAQPPAGSLFRCHPGVVGLPARACTG